MLINFKAEMVEFILILNHCPMKHCIYKSSISPLHEDKSSNPVLRELNPAGQGTQEVCPSSG